MDLAPFPIHPTYTGIAMAFKNDEMIADIVMPVATPVTKKFTFFVYPSEEALTVPDLTFNRRSETNTIELTATETPGVTQDFGLSDLVPNEDISNAPAGYDPLAHATETVMDLVTLGREVRVAGLVFNPASYDSDKKVQLSGTSQFSDVNSDPGQVLWEALDIPLMRPNLVTIGQPVWSKMATHPKLITKLYGAASKIGKARLQDLADFLEVPQCIVGKARVNTAKKGQLATLNRAWGKHIALTYTNRLANNERGMTFGMTFPKGDRRSVRIIPEPKVGPGGSQRVQVEEQLREQITASACGYFIQDAVA